MRALYVNQTAQVSGAELSLLTLLRGLDGAVEPLVACPRGELGALLGGIGIEPEPIAGTRASFRLHPRHTSRGLIEIGHSTLQVRCIVARLAPDLVHANSTRASLLALLTRKRSGPPVIAHIRDQAPDGRFPRAVLGTIARRADAVVATSHYVARQFDGLPLRGPVRVVYDPVEIERFDCARADGRAVRRELGISEDAIVLSVVGQLAPLKGQDDAIRALASLAATGSEVVLLLVGSVKFAGAGTRLDNVGFGRDLYTLADDLDVAERVHFLGERSDVPDVLAATDVMLMPFWYDAFGRVAVEAMAMGVPVVASKVGGPAEIVRSDVDGILLPPRAPDSWSRTIERLVADPELRERMGSSAKLRAADFDVEAHTTQILDLYRELSPGQSP
jgi:L-malate glycosyltransferase